MAQVIYHHRDMPSNSERPEHELSTLKNVVRRPSNFQFTFNF